MGDSPKVLERKVEQILTAWDQLRPGKRLAGMTLAEFRARLQPMQAARERVATLRAEMQAAVVARNGADRTARALIQLVVNGVRGDVEEGEDGSLYEAMGYIAKGKRKTGLTRKRKADIAPQPRT